MAARKSTAKKSRTISLRPGQVVILKGAKAAKRRKAAKR
jgi:hypothetical protein